MDWQDKASELWGESWKSTIAKMAQVNARTVRRWASGDIVVPDNIVALIEQTHKDWLG